MAQVYALLSVLLFIVSHSQVKSLAHFPVEEVVFFRAAGILLLSLPWMWLTQTPILGKDKRNLFLRGLFGTLAIFLYFLTLQKLPLATAVVLQQMSPLFAVVIASLMLKEKNPKLVYFFFVLALLGVHLIKGPSLKINAFYFAGLLSAALAALAYNFVRKLKATEHPLTVLTWFQFVLFPVALTAVLVRGNFHVPNLPKDQMHIAFLALFSFLAQVFLTLAYHAGRVSQVSVINFLSLPLSIVVGWFFYSEGLSGHQVAGIFLIFLAVLGNFYFNGRLRKKVNQS